MQLKEAMKQSGLTRKALDYYESKGLIDPRKLDNGYRDYSAEDVDKLRRIALYRGLGLSLEETRETLENKAALGSYARQKQWDARLKAKRADLLERLHKQGESPALMQEVEALLREESFSKRLNQALPSYLGQVMVLSFAPYLHSSCETPDQEAAFQALIAFMDELPPFDLPGGLGEYLEEVAQDIPLDMMEKVNQAKTEAVEDVDKWLASHAEALQQYVTYKASPEYQASPMAKIHGLIRDYFIRSGFYDTALPLLRRISPAYEAYQQQLLRANEQLLARMPELTGENGEALGKRDK